MAISVTIDAVSRFTGKSPLVCAPVVHDRDVTAALWEHSPRTRTFEGHACDILAISLRGDATLEQIENGRSVWRGPAPGSIVLLRSGDPTDWHLDGPFQMLHIYMANTPSSLEHLYMKLARPFRDPVLFQLARSVSLALTESGGNAAYMTPLLDSVQRCFRERYFEQLVPRPACEAQGLTGFARNAVMAFIQDHLATDLRSEDLAREAKLSVGHFNRAFRASFGFSPRQYILEQRIARAAALLSSSELKIVAIARLCGFSGANHLASEFRKRMGVSPSVYRRAA
jgi:AraC family transcriptional regulator